MTALREELREEEEDGRGHYGVEHLEAEHLTEARELLAWLGLGLGSGLGLGLGFGLGLGLGLGFGTGFGSGFGLESCLPPKV